MWIDKIAEIIYRPGPCAMDTTLGGWELSYSFPLMFCFAWPRPLLVGEGLTVFALLLEGLQAFPPDRSSNVLAALISAAGAGGGSAC